MSKKVDFRCHKTIFLLNTAHTWIPRTRRYRAGKNHFSLDNARVVTAKLRYLKFKTFLNDKYLVKKGEGCPKMSSKCEEFNLEV